MPSNTTTTAPVKPAASPFSLEAIISTLFMIELREKLDADTAGDKSDAAYTYGL